MRQRAFGHGAGHLFADGAVPPCMDTGDANDDGTVNWRDIDPFVALMNTTCP